MSLPLPLSHRHCSCCRCTVSAVLELDVASAVRCLARVRRCFDDNVEARNAHEREPIKFEPSEAELHEATVALGRYTHSLP